MQGAKTSKTVLPCRRGVHLHKLDLNKSEKNFANPKMIETMILKTSKKTMRKTYHPKYAKLSNVGSHFGASCSVLCGCDAFFLRPVFRNLWGGTYPLVPILVSPGAPLVRFCELSGIFQEQVCSKVQRFQNGTNHTFKTTGRDSKTIYR